MPCMILPWIENGDIRRYMKNHVSDTKQKAGWVGFPLAFTSQDSAMLMIYIYGKDVTNGQWFGILAQA